MIAQNKHTGIAIIIAWPETYCKQPGSWYDKLLPFFGINKYHYYKVGHAAIVLIDIKNLKCHYFDFGRYHTPFQSGRVRSARTDFDLKVRTTPKISKDGKLLMNYLEILNELQNNLACHGEGELLASYTLIDFEKAYQKACKIQTKSPIPYGPFLYKGSNCSRFVQEVTNAGISGFFTKIKLNWLVPFTPTPMSNVRAFGFRKTVPHPKIKPLNPPRFKLSPEQINTPIHQPERNRNIPIDAQWLSGEGAGSWFEIKPLENQILVNRFSSDGLVECSSFFTMPNLSSTDIKEYKITYPSNCEVLTLKKGDKRISLKGIQSNQSA